MNGPRPPISVVLADDHPVVLHGIAGILSSQPDINVVALCGDGIAAAKAIRMFVPEIAVLDISMPGLNGLDVLVGGAWYDGYISERDRHRWPDRYYTWCKGHHAQGHRARKLGRLRSADC